MITANHSTGSSAPVTPPTDSTGRRRGRVLIVDDEKNARMALDELLTEEGYVTETAADGRQALAAIEAFDPDVVVTDLKMPGMDGLTLLRQATPRARHAIFLVMTAFGSIDTAVEAIKCGAENYLTKPLDFDALTALVGRAVSRSHLSREAQELRQRVSEKFNVGSILGGHPSMQRLLKMIRQVAPSRATVLIQGESGTGKELIAAAIHQNSKRQEGPFVRLNCAALAETLLESELFGHEKGSFTGAMTRREGRFAQADGGTLFLDEVSEIPATVQVKLLRFLQEREFERVGGNDTIHVDVRVVAATNRDLKELVRRGEFREDLFYRLNVVQLDVPPLRERRSDIPMLAHHFLKKYANEASAELTGFDDHALRHLMSYPWPGNVRELENAVERAAIMAEAEVIRSQDFPPVDPTDSRSSTGGGGIPLGVPLAEIERIAIQQTLDAVDGSTAKAADMLGISQRKIQYRLRAWVDGD